MVKLKRVYDPVSRTDGTRFLVERLWPRGVLAAARRGTVTLVYSSHDQEHNNAVALKEYLQAKRGEPSLSRRAAAAERARADR